MIDLDSFIIGISISRSGNIKAISDQSFKVRSMKRQRSSSIPPTKNAKKYLTALKRGNDFFESGKSYYQEGKKNGDYENCFHQANTYLSLVSRKHPAYMKSQIWKARTFTRLEKYSKARECLDIISPGHPLYPEANYYKLCSYNNWLYYDGVPDDAFELGKTIPKTHPRFLKSQYFIGTMYLEIKKYEEAIEYLKQIPNNVPFFEASQYFMACALLALNRDEDASRCFQRLSLDCFEWLCNGTLDDFFDMRDENTTPLLKLWKEAYETRPRTQLWKEAYKTRPRTQTKKNAAEYCSKMGKMFFEAGRCDEAANWFKRIEDDR